MTYDAQGFLDGTASELDYETMVVAALRWLTYFGNNVHFEHCILLLCSAFFRAIKLQPKCEMTIFGLTTSFTLICSLRRRTNKV